MMLDDDNDDNIDNNEDDGAIWPPDINVFVVITDAY